MLEPLIECKISNLPNYCIDRKNPSNRDRSIHLLEVEGKCPMCGAFLIETSNKKTKLYEIAHIYPNSPTKEEKEILRDVIVFGNNSESFQNKIALCLDCHKNYDDMKNVDEYNEMLERKRRVYYAEQAKKELSAIDLYENIENLLDKIAKLDLSEEINIELKMKPVKITNKFYKSESLLKNKIKNYVTEYFLFIKDYAKNIAETKQLNFTILSTNIRLAYQMTAEANRSKIEIFNYLVEWLMSKTKSKDQIACEIIISYFVQTCEVFDEITQ